VLDRLRDLGGDRQEQLDLRRAEVARLAPSSFSRARMGTARIDSYSSSGKFGNALKRSSRCACAGIITGARASAADPVMPSPGRIRGRPVISSTRVPCVARSTSSSACSS